ncbi:hypothetical protein H6G81_20120 [Scytonema hofmannii FACHB-248]|uniref:Uncharacterized protein n=1 Tax=Scytonema hofmannii FACHB-248 TaxID=1842502 RepID=A0ABR8GTH7_9CYAN|nr:MULTISPECIES: hypothetical protein [Nostocales]MBD2606776.1 hypothetical protein [Scytonema hofmannii FACHB-248]
MRFIRIAIALPQHHKCDRINSLTTNMRSHFPKITNAIAEGLSGAYRTNPNITNAIALPQHRKCDRTSPTS